MWLKCCTKAAMSTDWTTEYVALDGRRQCASYHLSCLRQYSAINCETHTCSVVCVYIVFHCCKMPNIIFHKKRCASKTRCGHLWTMCKKTQYFMEFVFQVKCLFHKLYGRLLSKIMLFGLSLHLCVCVKQIY